MSATAEIWKHPLLKIARLRVHGEPAELAVPVGEDSYESMLSSLVRQMFFPTRDVQRKRVLLAATGIETNLAGFAEEIGKALSKLTHASVALVEDTAHSPETTAPRWKSDLANTDDVWHRLASQIAERIWRVPGFLFTDANVAGHSPHPEGLPPFEYLIFAATVTDTSFPAFCSESEGVVLALTANRTRKEPALQALRIVQQCDGPLLGTVLLDRKFPIPRSIYRRL
jgi:hypothetical protein